MTTTTNPVLSGFRAVEAQEPKGQAKAREDAESLANRLIQLYVSGGQDLSVAELVKAVGWSERRVRIALEHVYCWGIQRRTERRPSQSRDYPGFYTDRTHAVTVYGPSRAKLREELLVLGAQVAKAAKEAAGQAEG